MKKIIYSLWASATAFGLVGACGGDSSDPVNTPSNVTSGTTSPSTVSGTTGLPTTVTGTAAGTGTVTGTGTTGAMSTCTSTAEQEVGAEIAQVPASSGIYTYGDPVTSKCLTTAVNNLCLDGLGADAGPNYDNYGAGIGIKLAADDTTPWNATAANVVGVKFTLSGLSADEPVRASVTMVELTDYSFVGLSPNGYTADGEQTVLFSDLTQPSWVMDAEIKATPFDATNIHSLQFQLVTAQDVMRPYNFCVANITWIDAAGNAVELPWSTGGGEGGAGGEGPDPTTTTGTGTTGTGTTGTGTTGTGTGTTGTGTTGTGTGTTGTGTGTTGTAVTGAGGATSTTG